MRIARVIPGIALGLLAFAAPAQSSERGWQGANHRFFGALTEDDMLLPVSSIEWGAPDRWSLTARYVHMFTRDRNARPLKPRIHSATVTLSPGTDGARLGAGYQGVWRLKVPLLVEARLVALRTWGHPLSTVPGRTFLGPEFRCSITGVGNLGAGWYRCSSGGPVESFWGVHCGFGM